MRIYTDESLNNEIVNDLLAFGRLQAGEIKQFTFWVSNIPKVGENPVILENLEFKFNHPEVTLIEAPTEMEYNAVAELIFEWKPSVTLEEKLYINLDVKGLRVFG